MKIREVHTTINESWLSAMGQVKVYKFDTPVRHSINPNYSKSLTFRNSPANYQKSRTKEMTINKDTTLGCQKKKEMVTFVDFTDPKLLIWKGEAI